MRSALVLVAGLCAFCAAEQGARYLIITADQFASAVQPLAAWKHASGMSTKVARLSEVGPDTASIRSYIRNAYLNWPVRPEFVLLVGHPTYLASMYYRTGGHFSYYSDNYYADITGDIRAEVALGRFPCKSAYQCSVMVAKTLAYEKEPYPADSSWMCRLVTIVREDYDPDDTIYWNNARHAARLAGEAGFERCDSFASSRGHSAQNVVNSVNAGTGLVLYRGTAGGNWREPFDVSLGSIANGNKLPIILSITCETMTLDPYDSMIGNGWILAGTPSVRRGAAAFFGNTHSASNVAPLRGAVTRGFFTGLFTEGRYQLGQAMLRAKEQLYQEFPQYTSDYRGFSLFGDPELRVWTASPIKLTVDHPTQVLPGNQEIQVTVLHDVQPVTEALVCISMDTTVYVCDTTDSQGRALIPVNPTDTGVMRLVVTKRNFRPYDAPISVVTQIGVDQPPAPVIPSEARDATSLLALPNSFRKTTTFRWSSPEPLATRAFSVAVCEPSGRIVRRFDNLAGTTAFWDGTSESGRPVQSGVYFAVLLERSGAPLAQTKLSKLR